MHDNWQVIFFEYMHYIVKSIIEEVKRSRQKQRVHFKLQRYVKSVTYYERQSIKIQVVYF